MMAGGLSFESQYLINGVVVNENLRGQALNLFIEDAIQETKVSTGAISAEYGRFGGGVVNMITKSGGNSFSGSFRTTFNNDALAIADAVSDRPDRRQDHAGLRGHARRTDPARTGSGSLAPAGSRSPKRTGRSPSPASTMRPARRRRRYEGKMTYALNAEEQRQGRVHEADDGGREQPVRHDHGPARASTTTRPTSICTRPTTPAC